MKSFSSNTNAWIAGLILVGMMLLSTYLVGRIQSPASADLAQVTGTPIYLPQVRIDPSPTPNCSPPNTLPGADEQLEGEMFNELNVLRFNRRGDNLLLQYELINTARSHAKDMSENNFVGHQDSNQEFNQYRQEQNCYFSTKQGEVIGATNTAGAAAMINIWLSDEGTYGFENALYDGTFDDIGVGYWPAESGSDYAHYWDLSFGKRAIASSRAGAAQEIACEFHFVTEDGEATIRLYDPALCESDSDSHSDSHSK